MGQGKHAVVSQERRVKRLGYRYGVLLMKCAKPFGKVAEHGGYMLRDEETRSCQLRWTRSKRFWKRSPSIAPAKTSQPSPKRSLG